MIINNCKTFKTNDPSKFAWSRISQFLNIDHTASVITHLHNLKPKQLHNAKQQAEQIKYCLIQAKEYFDAASAVSLATRPVLLYYSAMSMALSEILLKQTGDSRLSTLRQEHNCHGLQLGVKALPKPEENLKDSASNLIAKSQTDKLGKSKGTFEVWRRSAREHPSCGQKTIQYPQIGESNTFAVLLQAEDIPPPNLSQGGISLLDCLTNLPYMGDLLARSGAPLEMVRATLSINQIGDEGIPTLTSILHPTEKSLLDKFGNLVLVHPSAVNHLRINELPSGYIINQTLDPEKPTIFQWPHSICLTNKEIYFSCARHNLGEMGFLYVALHICGNFARYYPDYWLKHIEKNSPLAMAIDELCNHAFERLPLLNLSELNRIYYVLEK